MKRTWNIPEVKAVQIGHKLEEWCEAVTNES